MTEETTPDLVEHRQAQDAHYSREDFAAKPWGYTKEYVDRIGGPRFELAARNLIPGSILDVGGGYGYLRHFTQGRWQLNLDISEVLLGHDSGTPKAVGASEQLPVRDDTFDNVVNIGVLGHVADPAACLREAFRVLRRGGRLVVMTPRADWLRRLAFSRWFPLVLMLLIEYLPRKVGLHRYRNFADQAAGGKSQTFDRVFLSGEIEAMLRGCGFHVVEWGYKGKDLPGRWVPPDWLVERFFDESKFGRFVYLICDKA